MILPRTKLIEEFRQILLQHDGQYIALVAPSGWGKTTFLTLLEQNWLLDMKTTIFVKMLDIATFSIQKPKTLIFDNDDAYSFDEIRAFIESNMFDWQVIFTTQEKWEEDWVVYFTIPWISLREYAEWYGKPLEIWEILGWTADITELNHLRDEYIHLWQYGYNISHPEDIERIWDDKISIMILELFEKEKEVFIEFIRTLAMNIGDLFKEDRIAKTMNISRRKVRKYTELLMKYDMIRAMWPYGDHPDTELFRHVKIYFSDLSYLAIALGVGYYHGSSKQGVIENFVYLELARKLDDSHEIRFYRKKSGAEVSFVLVDKDSSLITPIDITTRPTDTLSQALKLFEETYHDKIERVMFLNEEKSWQKELNGKMLIILPHVAI